MADRTAARVVTYGFARDADVAATDVASSGFDGMRFVLRADGQRMRRRDPGLGRLASTTPSPRRPSGLVVGTPIVELAAALAAGWQAPHRGEVIRAGGVTILDDTYNASPGSVAAALDALAGLPGRRVAVLGEMLELGPATRPGIRRSDGRRQTSSSCSSPSGPARPRHRRGRPRGRPPARPGARDGRPGRGARGRSRPGSGPTTSSS